MNTVKMYTTNESDILENLTIYNVDEVLKNIINDGTNNNVNQVLFQFIKKLPGLDTPLEKIVVKILNYIQEKENNSAIYISLLEILGRKKDSTSKLRVLEELEKTKLSRQSIIEVLGRAETENLLVEILITNESNIEEFLRYGIQARDGVVMKNMAGVITRLPIKYFEEYEAFGEMLYNEYHGVRSGFLEIIGRLIEDNKEKKNIERIRELTEIVEEKVNDVNFLVRSKALGIIYNLFRQDSVLKSQRNQIIRRIVERIWDKTIIVRKKAINILGEILINHPFRDKVNFEGYVKVNNTDKTVEDNCDKTIEDNSDKINNCDKTIEDNSDKINNCDKTIEDNSDKINKTIEDKTVGDNSDKINKTIEDKTIKDIKDVEDDCEIFVKIMCEGLRKITRLMERTAKSDLGDIVTFIKYSYFMKLEGWREAVRTVSGLIEGNGKEIVINFFQEIVNSGENTIYEISRIGGFLEIVGDLKLNTRQIINDFYGERTNEASSILSRMKNKISMGDAERMIEYSTKILFGSRNENELKINIRMYVNILKAVTRLEMRIESSHEILRTITKNVVKMVFFERSVVKTTVRLIYSISQNPEKNVGKLLNHLCLGQSVLKIIDAVGWVAVNEYYLLERLENNYKGRAGRNNINSSTTEAIKALETNTEYLKFRESINSTEFRDRRKSIEEGKRISIGAKISLKMNGLNKQMKNKTEEEIADFFFYLKEKEIIYSKNSLLSQFISLVLKSLTSTHSQVRNTAYSTVFRLMMISSDFFFENKIIIRNALADPLNSIRQNAVASLHDLYILYNSSLESGFIFDLLADSAIRKNVLLVIYSLLLKKIIRVKNNSTKLIEHISDPSTTSIVKTILKSLSSDNNSISTIFYEAFLGSVSIDVIIYLCSLIDKKIHEPLFLKCLKSDVSSKKIKVVFEHLDISETFITQNMIKDKL